MGKYGNFLLVYGFELTTLVVNSRLIHHTWNTYFIKYHLNKLIHLFFCCKRILKYEKLTDGRWTPSDGNTSHDPLGQVS
jgi:hypothetical protein